MAPASKKVPSFLANLPPLQAGEYDVILPYHDGKPAFTVNPVGTRFLRYVELEDGSPRPAQKLRVFRNTGDQFLLVEGISLSGKSWAEKKNNFIKSSILAKVRGYHHFRMRDSKHDASVTFQEKREALEKSIKECKDRRKRQKVEHNQLTQGIERSSIAMSLKGKTDQMAQDIKKKVDEMNGLVQKEVEDDLKKKQDELNNLVQKELAYYEQKVRELKTIALDDDDDADDNDEKDGSAKSSETRASVAKK